ncbi:hypothetical protein A2Z22_01525 [Candidatus Woesebacteria bacterium RBG_16_34_12]|uniref:HTH crp-type domain-containing protein n=1 Tax=Candidatus Woesebacteria bacterium RBG_16_34_12 TaxID=1802480 RepID=A0A1F7XAA5_9BACT|nr:MAG: hypothetical protein A2Z22_01525 [Candidatus Woesebacteria bacterium RBG_16_34_12]
MNVKNKIEKFFSQYKEYQFPKKYEILGPNEQVFYIYFIKEGFVRSYSISEEGSEITLNIYKSGSFFPFTLALSDKINPHFYESLTKIEVYKAPYKDVLKFVKDDCQVLFDLTKRLSSGLEGFVLRTQFLLRTNAVQKTASDLYLLAKRFGKNLKSGDIIIELPLTHQEIANLTGLARETTSVILKKMEKEGIIGRKGKYWIIKNIKELKQKSLIYIEDKALPLSY